MDTFLDQIVLGIVSRVVGPMHFRFILQPISAIILGIRDGKLDSNGGVPPFIYDVIFKKGDRKTALRGAFKRLMIPMLVGVVIDSIAQYLIFQRVRLIPAIIVGVFVMSVPYSLSRGISNRLFSSGKKDPVESSLQTEQKD